MPDDFDFDWGTDVRMLGGGPLTQSDRQFGINAAFLSNTAQFLWRGCCVVQGEQLQALTLNRLRILK